MNLVFVYGTLRSGFGNHSLMFNSVKIGIGVTKNKYALYQARVPFLVEDEPIHNIKGELYIIDELTLNSLDMLEGHPTWYKRKIIEIIVDKKVHKAWAYFNKKQGTLIKSGDYAEKENSI